jgi:acyl-CoA thioester hydrolase
VPARVEVWRGGVNTWDCDEMGHMNVRHYVSRAMEGLAGLAEALCMPQAFCTTASATLLVRDITSASCARLGRARRCT